MALASYEAQNLRHETPQEQIESILNRQLSPENIDTFADDALDDLVAVVDDTVGAYAQQPTTVYGSGKDTEAAAFAYFGMGDVESVLDHVAQKAEEIHELDTVIERADTHSTVIVPPEAGRPIMSGEGSFEAKDIIPRTKTTLFLLANEHNIDLHDPQQLRLHVGQITPGMMRQTSYHLIEVPSLHRDILVCDEEGNQSFVFDTIYLQKLNISPDALLTLSKPELKALIQEHPDTGQGFKYSDNFVSNMLNAIDDPRTVQAEPQPERVVTLRPQAEKAPEGYLSIKGFADTLGSSAKYLAALMKDIDPEIFGPVTIYKFGGNSVPGYSPRQQELLRAAGEARGKFAVMMPEGYVGLAEFASMAGLSTETVTSTFEKINPELLGTVERYRNKRSDAIVGLSPSQQVTLRAKLEENGLFLPMAPEGYLSIRGIAKKFKLNNSTVEGAIKSMDEEEFGHAERFRFASRVTQGYSPGQIQHITEKLEARGAFLDQPPEGYVSFKQFWKEYGVNKAIMQTILETTDNEELKSIDMFKFKTTRGMGLSPREQEVLLDELTARGVFDRVAPKDYTSLTAFARNMKVSRETVEKAIENLDPEDLGELRTYQFQAKTTRGLSPIQQEKIEVELYRSGLLVPVSPEGYLSRSGVVKFLGSNQAMVEKAIAALEAEGKLEAPQNFRFPKAPRAYRGFSPADQEVIKQWLFVRGTTMHLRDTDS
ncbi:MAG TPA: hypothetical protein VN031_03105 [Candidatus Microsaccharimonas sp.]|nr:hypothetical protein [Candidatus Microsaccharimonas sp.]